MRQDKEGAILDVSGGTLHLRVSDYRPVPEDEWYYHWAWIDVSMHGKGFDIETSSPSLLCVEIENLRFVLERLIYKVIYKDWMLPECELEPEKLEFIEPYHRFIFYPPAVNIASKLGIEKGMQGFDLFETSADWEIELQHGGLLVVVRLDRDNLEKLLAYLQGKRGALGQGVFPVALAAVAILVHPGDLTRILLVAVGSKVDREQAAPAFAKATLKLPVRRGTADVESVWEAHLCHGYPLSCHGGWTLSSPL